jgi:hypothetical protein
MGSLVELGIDFAQRLGYFKNGDAQVLTTLREHMTKTLRALMNFIEKSKVQGL